MSPLLTLWTCSMCSLGTPTLVHGQPLCARHASGYHDFVRRVDRCLAADVPLDEAMPAIGYDSDIGDFALAPMGDA